MLEVSGETESGSAEEQPDKEYPDRGRVEDVPWPEGGRPAGPFFVSPSNAFRPVMPQKTFAAVAATIVLAAQRGGDDAGRNRPSAG